MYRIALFVLLSGLTFVAVDSSARAQTASAKAPAGYDAAIDAALAEFEAGNFAEARSQFLKAHAIFPNARTLRALGKTDYELKNYRDAVAYLEQALESRIRPLTAEQRSEAQKLLDSARGYLGRYTITVRPHDAKVFVDGAAIAPHERSPLVLSVGDHVLLAEADGYVSQRRELRVIGGGNESLSIELKPIEVVPQLAQATLPVDDTASAPLAPAPADEPRPARKKWWVWATVIGVLAGGAVATALLVTREPKTAEPAGGNTGVALIPPSTR